MGIITLQFEEVINILTTDVTAFLYSIKLILLLGCKKFNRVMEWSRQMIALMWLPYYCLMNLIEGLPVFLLMPWTGLLD